MEKPKNRPAPEGESITGRRKPRRSSIIQPAAEDEAGLETYEQSPERPDSEGRGSPDTPDGPVPPVTKPIPPD